MHTHVLTAQAAHRSQRLSPRPTHLALALAAAIVALAPGAALAQAVPTLPVGSGVPVYGVGSVSSDGSTVMTIKQTSDRMVMNWQSFDVGQFARVDFEQPGTNAAVLNLVHGGILSQINGTLTADGQVFLLNPAGVIFGSDAQISVAGLVASTLGTDPVEFMAGTYRFDAGGAVAEVLNRGSIAAAAGGVTLVGGSVVNQGLIQATAGNINLVGADAVTLSFESGGFSVVIDKALQSKLASVAINNTGSLIAPGRVITLQASAAQGVFDNLINLGGTVRANGILPGDNDGSVALIAHGAGQLAVGGGGGINVDSGSISFSTDQSVQQTGAYTVGSLGGTIGGDASFSNSGNRIAALDSLDVSGNLALSNAIDLAQTGALSVGGTSNFNLASHALTLTNAGNDFQGAVNLTGGNTQIADSNALTLGTVQTGNLTATSAGALNLGSGTVAGALNANSNNGAIGQNGALTVTGTSRIDAGSGAITLANAGNDFGGAASLSGNGISLVDSNDLEIAALNNDSNTAVSLIADGSLLLPTSAIATGSSDLTLVARNGMLGMNGALSGRNLSLTGGNGLNLNGDVVASGNLALTTSNAAIVQLAGGVTVGGTSAIDAGAGAITLTNLGNDFLGTVNLAGGNTQIVDSNALTLGTVQTGSLTASASTLNLGSGTVAGVLNANGNNGVIGQSGALTVVGTSNLNAGTGAINLANAGNDFQGAVSLIGGNTQVVDGNALALGAVATGNLSATSTGALNLGSGAVAGALNAASNNGAISQSGALSVAGTSHINAGTGAITLVNAGNDFQGVVNVAGGNTQVVDNSALTLGAVQTGNLTATSTGALNLGTGTIAGALNAASHNGAIGQSGALTVAGTSRIDAGTGAITLANTGNDFRGAVSLAGGNTQLVDSNALMLGTVATGSLDATSAAALNLGSGTVAGALNAASNNGAIGQSGALTVAGTSRIDAGTGAITLANTGNDFRGAVSLAGGNTQLVDSNALTLGTVAIGSLDATSAAALNLGSGTVAGALNATSHNGAIGQSGALTVVGASHINAGTGAITLANAGNDFQGTINLAGGNTQVVDSNALTLGALATGNLAATSTGALSLGSGTVAGALNATSNNGAIGQSGALTVVGASHINAGTGAITLTNAGNDFQDTVSLIGGNMQVVDGNALALGAVATGNLSATSTGALNLGSGAVAGALNTASNNGAISQSGALSVTGTSHINAGTGAITLVNAGNDFRGAVSLAGGNTQLVDSNALTLGTVAIGSLDATSAAALNLGSGTVAGALNATSHNGAIGQSGALTVVGASHINAGTGAITLANAGNDFQGTINLAGGNTQVVDSNALTLGALATGNLAATSTGALSLGSGTVAGALNATSNNGAIDQNGALSVVGASRIDAGTGAITLANAGNDFQGAVSLSGGATQVVDSNALTLGTVATGDLSATSTGSLNLGSGSVAGVLNAASHNGAIGQSGALSVAGASNVDAGNGVITLANVGNDFQGAVSLNGGATQIVDVNALTLGAMATGDFSATSTGVLNLGNGIVAGALNANSNNGAIGQSGALTVVGASHINAGTGAITLTNAGNDFQGTVNLAGGNTHVVDSNALTLGTVATGNLAATSTGALNLGSGTVAEVLNATSNNGAIGQSGALTVSGASNLNAGAGAITLTNAGNDFNGAVSLSGGATQIVDSNSLTLGAVVTGDLSATGTGALNLGSGTVNGTLDATSNNGAIGQTGALSISGTSSINAGSGAMTLDNAGNDFGGAASVTGNGIRLTDRNDLVVATLNNGNNAEVSLIADRSLILPVTPIATGGDLTLIARQGTLGVRGALSGNNLTLAGGGGLSLDHDVTAAGNLALTSADAAIVQQAGVLTVGGNSTLDAGSGAITLTNAGNHFAGAVNIRGGAVNLRDSGALTLGTLTAGSLTVDSTGALNLGNGTVNGTLSATSYNGAIGQNGALSVSGASSVNAGTDTITLTNAGNDFQGAVSLSGDNTQIVDSNALTLGTVATGDLDATSAGALNLGYGTVDGTLNATSHNGAIGQNGALSVTGASSINAGTGAITLTNAGNDFQDVVGLSGDSSHIRDANALTLGALATGSLNVASDGALNLGQGTVAGDLRSDSGGTVSQRGALNVSGSSTINSGGAAIVLADAGNDFGSALNLNGGSVTVRDRNALILGNLAVGALTVTSDGALSLGQGSIGGDLVGRSDGGAAGAGAGSGSRIGAASVTTQALSGGDITQGGALSVVGSSTLEAGTGSIVLDNAGNDFQGVLQANGGNVTIVDRNDLAVMAQASGALALSAAGNLDMVGALSGGNIALSSGSDLILDHDVASAGSLQLSSGGTITQSAGTLTAAQLRGSAGGTATLTGDNAIAALGDFSASQLSLRTLGDLAVNGAVAVDGAMRLSAGGSLAIDGAIGGTNLWLQAEGNLSEGNDGRITADTLSGSVGGRTQLGGRDQVIDNRIGTLGDFASPGGFSLSNGQSLTLASLNGSAYTVNAGTAPLYLSVRGDLLQHGTTWLYNGAGVYSASGRIGTAANPIYVTGVNNQTVAAIGVPPAYFYAFTADGALLGIDGESGMNVPASAFASRAQSSSNRTIAFVDLSAANANYRAFGLVQPGIRLPADQLPACDIDDPDADCEQD
ncbi:filamentous hemagglutinin N-terminal domain-containing protein [Lysobacter cavernae]|uniref:Filamentous hemagglutinin N-terminal domain-containing protein n=1 Tax=Lysobacter cavernae TaxID=1685901 RepID=A0ABV7RLN8_9GAMM